LINFLNASYLHKTNLASADSPTTTMAEAIGSEMTPEERYELITRNLQEVLGGEAILQKLKNNEQISLYWGTATTGRRR
jgi:hypothetical protein